MQLRFTPTGWLYLGAALISIGLSIWLNINVLINNDGILYLQAAQAFVDGGFFAAKEVYSWPFYSIVIALLHQLTHLPLEQAAFLLNTFLYVLIICAFITLIKELGGNFQVQVFAAVVILTHTGLNDYRDYIIRDFGHWAFMLYALYFLIIYAQKPKLHFALAWGCTILIAFLFRTEALFVMLFAPLVLLFPYASLPFSRRLLRTLGAYVIFVPLLIVMVFSFVGSQLFFQLLSSNPWLFLDFIHFTTPIETFLQFRQTFSPVVQNDELIYILLGGLVTYFTVRLFLLLSPLYTFLGAYAVYKKSLQPSMARRLIFTFVIIYLIIVLGFLIYKMFLSGRYIMPIVLLLSLWAPFGLSALYDTWKKRKNWLFPFVVLVFIYMLGDSLISFAPSQVYQKDASEWLKTHVPPQATICTNSRQINYYNPSVIYKNQIAGWEQCDYFALVTNRNAVEFRELIKQFPIQSIIVFANDRDDRVEIFENAQGRSRTGTGD